MSQPGWYPDPQGAGRRWWDGTNWTQHVQAAPSPPPPAPHQPAPPPQEPYGGGVPASESPQPTQGPVLDTFVDKVHLHADPQVIAYNNASIALGQVEWVRYWVVGNRARGLFGLGTIRVTEEWHFEVGRYPLKQAPMVGMVFLTFRKNTRHEAWAFLVDLVQRYLEPRLVAELAERVRGGETVDVGAGVQVHQGGFQGANASLPWQSVGGTQVSGGRVWIYQAGVAKPVLSVPHQNPNAVLIPKLFAAVRS